MTLRALRTLVQLSGTPDRRPLGHKPLVPRNLSHAPRLPNVMPLGVQGPSRPLATWPLCRPGSPQPDHLVLMRLGQPWTPVQTYRGLPGVNSQLQRILHTCSRHELPRPLRVHQPTCTLSAKIPQEVNLPIQPSYLAGPTCNQSLASPASVNLQTLFPPDLSTQHELHLAITRCPHFLSRSGP